MNEKEAQAVSAQQGLEQEPAQQPLLFALDIGTRSVIGVLGMEENGLLRVLDVAVREHTKRAMIDGQIEDIAQVAAVARAVREELEARQGVRLRRVCVAAAGRALKTLRAIGEIEFGAQRSVTARDVYELEMDAVDKARRQLLRDSEQNGEDFSFYCVGHAVIRYDLDGYSFSTIKGHKARKAKAEVIATFLPSAVVDSLYSAMEQAGMQVESVTLEPIAAMNAVIPQEIRLLNLALVDVGAGTSDIAISEDGSVSAYTMATTAGDEISEELIRTCLVDFETAERIKQTAGSAGNDNIPYEDILGVPGALTRKEALARIRPAVEALAQVICTKILEANGEKAPTAVFLVGGGGKTPYLGELVAQGLGLEPGKVALGGNNLFKRLAVSSKEITGPEYATPLGIALTAVGDETRESFFINVNSKPVLAVYSKEMTALDVLLMAGYKYTDLMGQSGQGLVYFLDGKECRVRGERFRPASLQINGKAAAISDRVNRGDALTVEPAVPGRDASLTVGQLLQRTESSFFVIVNGERCNLARTLLKNGRPIALSDTIAQGDELSFVPPTLSDVCTLWGLEPETWSFSVNDEPAELSQALYYEDNVTWTKASAAVEKRAEATEKETFAQGETPQLATADSGAAQDRVTAKSVNGGARSAAKKAETIVQEAVQTAEADAGQAQEADSAPVKADTLADAFAEVRQAKAAWEAELAREAEQAAIAAAQAPQAASIPDAPDAMQSDAEKENTPEHTVETAFVQQNEQAQAVADTASDSVPEQAAQGEKASVKTVLPTEKALPDTNAAVSGFLRVTVNGKETLLPRRDTPYQFLDLLPLAGMDFKKPEGDVQLLHNGQEASYLDLITNGDDAVIGWKERETL